MIRLTRFLFAKPVLFVRAGIVITLATTALTIVALYQMRLDAMAQARDATSNLASSLQNEIGHRLDLYRLAMHDVAATLQTPLLQLPPEVRQHLAFDNARDLGTLFATDATGKLVLDSVSVPPRPINVSDRDYFLIQQQHRHAGLYLSKPYLTRSGDPDQPSIALSQRLDDSNGQFQGIVAGSLRLSFFHRLFEDSILGKHGTVTLLRADGTVLMRQPYRPVDLGASLAGSRSFRPLVQSAQDSYVSVAVIDHVKRLYSSRRIGGYPLVVVVGFATRDIYAQWYKRALTIGIVMVVLNLLFILVSLMFSRQLSKRATMERQLKQLAWFDSLTGLPNRAQLRRESPRVLKRASQHGASVAALFIDLDRFKRVNDTQGHAAGDAVLREIARRLREFIHGDDVVGRLGGDEFLALLQHCDVLKATHVAGRILQAVYEPVVINSAHHASITISASIGIALYPHDGRDADALLRNADLALYRAKSGGRNQVHFYDPEYERLAQEQLGLEIALQQALKDGSLSVAYQPKVDATGALRGAEALVRWHHDTLGFVPPDRLVAIAEENGLVADLDAWMLNEACRQLAEWRTGGLAVPNISVNVSAADFKRPEFADFVAQTLGTHGLTPADLTLEMTERVMFDESADDIRLSIEAIHALGVALSIDDFGTGYSSLSYLHRFPVQELKIDKSFVQGIGDNAMAESLAQTVMNIGNALKLQIVAEGVETAAQRDFLNQHGCHLYQGYLFSRPLPARDFALWVARRQQAPVSDQASGDSTPLAAT